jgi:hypothetical protein
MPWNCRILIYISSMTDSYYSLDPEYRRYLFPKNPRLVPPLTGAAKDQRRNILHKILLEQELAVRNRVTGEWHRNPFGPDSTLPWKRAVQQNDLEPAAWWLTGPSCPNDRRSPHNWRPLILSCPDHGWHMVTRDEREMDPRFNPDY